MMGVAEVITVERRRRWQLSEKRRVVAETLEPGASVSEVARRHGVHPSQLFAWRKLARDGGLQLESEAGGIEPRFTPVMIETAPVCDADPSALVREASADGEPRRGRMEIALGSDVRVTVFADVDAVAFKRVMAVLARR